MSEPAPDFEEVFGALFTEPQPRSALSEVDVRRLLEESDGQAVGGHVDTGDREPRFDGDTGELPAEVCWALQELVAASFVSEKSKKRWAVIRQYEKVLRSRLSELGLVLHLNVEHGHAFTRQAGDPNGRVILRTRTLSLAASALLLYLYNCYVVAADEAVVEESDMIDHMMAYKRADDTDEAAFQNKMRTAIGTLENASIIKPVRGTSRYVIDGVIASILTAEQVDALIERFNAAGGGLPEQEQEAEQDEEGEGD